MRSLLRMARRVVGLPQKHVVLVARCSPALVKCNYAINRLFIYRDNGIYLPVVCQQGGGWW